MNFEFISPQKIVFGKGISAKTGKLIKSFGSKVLILTGSISQKDSYKKIRTSLHSEKINFIEYFYNSGEPETDTVDEITDFAVQNNINCVVSIGGGSVIDTGKAVSALVTNRKGVANYLEGVGKNFQIEIQPLPFIAIPTTAGSGAEVTKNAVICNFKEKYKKSFRDEKLIAKLVIGDPELTLSLPEKPTMFGGMDALCQLIESLVTKKQNPYTNALSLQYIPLIISIMSDLKNNLDNIDLRTIMLEASIASGLCLANSGLGAVHGLASGLGGMYKIPHGLICAVLLPYICRINEKYIDDLFKKHGFLNLPDTLIKLNNKLEIPSNLKSYAINKKEIDEIIEKSKGGSMTGNPIELSYKDLFDLLSTVF